MRIGDALRNIVVRNTSSSLNKGHGRGLGGWGGGSHQETLKLGSCLRNMGSSLTKGWGRSPRGHGSHHHDRRPKHMTHELSRQSSRLSSALRQPLTYGPLPSNRRPPRGVSPHHLPLTQHQSMTNPSDPQVPHSFRDPEISRTLIQQLEY